MKHIDEMMTMVKMRDIPIPPISLLLVALSLTASIKSDNIPKIKDLGCLNDYHNKMVCFWEVLDPNRNCSKEFRLFYENFEKKKECLDLENDLGSNKCICNIKVNSFAPEESFEIKVESREKLVGNTTILILSTIKPTAPSNVQVDFQEENAVVQWDAGYDSKSIRVYLTFQVQIICKHNQKVEKEGKIKMNTKYPFNKKQLKRGENYGVRVRTKPEGDFQGTWSEWSSEAEWTNDYSLTIQDLKDIIIPVTCIVMLCLIIFGYICLTRYKKKWWDSIPDPAKSTIIKKKLIQKHELIPDRKCPAIKSCGSFFSKIVKGHKSKCDHLTQHETVPHHAIVNSDSKKFIFELKNEEIERCLEMYPKGQDENDPVQERKPENKTEDQPFEEDLSIANMFFAILCDSSSMEIETLQNLNAGSFGCPVLMDSYDKEEKQQSNLSVPGHLKLGYQNYYSDECPLVHSSDINVAQMPCFEQWPGSQIDCVPYTPQVSINEHYSFQSNRGPLENPGYNSFANAVSEARKDVTDTTKALCLDNCSKSSVLGKTNIYKWHLNPKGINYYNTKYFSLHVNENSFQPSETGPTSVCEVSGYQSFDQAVQENEPELGSHMSGYKSFDQAVQQGDETSVSEMNGYTSFNQTAQEHGSGFGGPLSGYKCFDQTVEDSDGTSVCEVIGYLSFDQAVHESETSGSTNCSSLDSGYKPFESLLCQDNDYSDKNGLMCEDDHIKDSHCENDTNFDNNQEYKLLSSNLMEIKYGDFVKATKEKYPSFSDKPFNALKIAVDSNFNKDMALNTDGIPLALTFDICEHLRNLKNMHGHKMLLNNLKTGAIPMNEAIFPCHMDKVLYTEEQLTINKDLILYKCHLPTQGFENIPFILPVYLDVLDPGHTSKHLLMQQSSLDKDGNSYMKIK